MATFLVVDDDPYMLETASVMLELAGHEVLRAGSGEAALKLCAEPNRAIHLVLTDIEMPLMNGPELAARLYSLIPHVAIVFMTAHCGQAPVQGMPVGGMPVPGKDVFGGHCIIRKPFTAAELRKHMETVLPYAAARQSVQLDYLQPLIS